MYCHIFCDRIVKLKHRWGRMAHDVVMISLLVLIFYENRDWTPAPITAKSCGGRRFLQAESWPEFEPEE